MKWTMQSAYLPEITDIVIEFHGHTFEYEAEGTLFFDPGKGTKHYDPYWCIVKVDPDLARYYRWHLLNWGQATHPPNSLWGFHISAIKGEEPLRNKEKWGKYHDHIVKFYYGKYVSYSNGRHAWLNCYCEELTALREFYGLDVNNRKLKYHATLGRLKRPTAPDIKRPGTVYDDGNGLCSV